MNTIDIILAIATLLLGGGNIAQFAQLRAAKRKNSAEAYQSEIESLRTIIDGNVKEITRLQTAYSELQEKYFAISNDMVEIRKKLINI